MTECEGIQEIVHQTTVQAVTAVMKVLWCMDVRPWLAHRVSTREAQRKKHGGPALKSSCSIGMYRAELWDGCHKYSWDKST